MNQSGSRHRDTFGANSGNSPRTAKLVRDSDATMLHLLTRVEPAHVVKDLLA
jgi:hypothetical protein